MGEHAVRCCTTCKQNNVFFSVLAAETLVIVPCTVMTIINLARYNQTEYETNEKDLSKVVNFYFLPPLLAAESLWLLTNAITIFAIFCITPYLLLPNIVAAILGIIVVIFMVGFTVDALISNSDSVSVFSIILVICLVIFLSTEVFILILRFSTFKRLVKRKKAVTGTMEKPAVQDVEEVSTTFSRRSTMSMTDERLELPPRI